MIYSQIRTVPYNLILYLNLSTTHQYENVPHHETEDIQGSANPRTPGSEKMRMKSCVLLPAAGRKTQLFILIFSEPGVRGLADPCM